MLLNEMHVRQLRADREREIAERARVREHVRASRRESPSVRRVVGRSMISIGSRLANEPQPRLARSR
jgi:hypothetical protein